MSVEKLLLHLGVAVMLTGLAPGAGFAQGQGNGNGNGNGNGHGQEVAASHRNNEAKEAKENNGQDNANQHRRNILFTLQDKVIRFEFPSGLGAQVGTATGRINGVSITNFDFDINFETGEFSFDNWAGITDLDGDQIIFHVLGEGQFVVAPIVAPGDPIPVLGMPGGPLGGPVGGTYEVAATSGKYAEKYEVGERFPFRAIGYNPNPVAVTPPSDEPLGSVYVEVYSNRLHDDADDGEGEGEDAAEE